MTSDPEQEESDRSRLNRNWLELLQELRVAQTGVQILTGFLLTLPFTGRFQELPTSRVVVYAFVLCAAVIAVFLLMTPVALHRAVFRRGRKNWLVEVADVAARAGLAALAVANVTAVWLVLDVVGSTLAASIIAGVLTVLLIGLWLVLPAFSNRTPPPP